MKQYRLLLAIILTTIPCILNAQDWIPAGAKVCYKSHYEDGLLSDGDFRLKLKISKNQFDAIVTKLGATPHTESRKYSDDKIWLRWNPDSGPNDPFGKSNKTPPKGENLWDPDTDLSTTFVRQHKNTWTFLKYERGYLYFKQLTH